MKKPVFLIGVIIWALIAVLALGVLIAVMTGNFSFPGTSFSFGSESVSLVREESVSSSGLGDISISVPYHDIKLNQVDSGEVRIRQYDRNSENLFTITEGGGSLDVNIRHRNLVSFMSFGSATVPRLEVDIPESYAGNVVLSASSGSITLDTHAAWQDASISTSSGTVRFPQGISCRELIVDTSSGSITLGDIDADSAVLSSNSGTQRHGELRITGGLKISSTSGSITAGNISSDGCTVSANSGTIRLGTVKSGGEINIETTSGSITGGNLTGINIALGTSSGTISLGNISDGGKTGICSNSGSHNVGNVVSKGYDISSTSGTLRYDGISGDGYVGSTSGSITCSALDVRGDVMISSASGTQRHTLAQNPSFELQIDTGSGSINTGNIEVYYRGKKADSAFGTVGDGKGKLTLESSSGSITIG